MINSVACCPWHITSVGLLIRAALVPVQYYLPVTRITAMIIIYPVLRTTIDPTPPFLNAIVQEMQGISTKPVALHKLSRESHSVAL